MCIIEKETLEHSMTKSGVVRGSEVGRENIIKQKKIKTNKKKIKQDKKW